jgi:hypothetical protein
MVLKNVKLIDPAVCVVCFACLLGMSGCNILGPVGAVAGKAFPSTVEAAYKGLAHQPVVVLVWADRGIRIDNPNLQLDLATGIEQKLKTLQTGDKPKELIGTTFPVRPDSVARFQEDHPEMEFEPIDQTAAKFNTMFKATRLIYIEVSDFSTRSDSSLALHLGNLTGSIRVLEMSNGTAKEAYRESDIHVSFPKDSPPEGLPIGTDYKIYQGTLDLFTTQLAQRLSSHEADDDSSAQ